MGTALRLAALHTGDLSLPDHCNSGRDVWKGSSAHIYRIGKYAPGERVCAQHQHGVFYFRFSLGERNDKTTLANVQKVNAVISTCACVYSARYRCDQP